MATLYMRLCVPRIIILAIAVLVQMIVTVRSVCLPDALSFYGSGRACGFYWRDFNNVFMDSTELCQIDCSVDTQPHYIYTLWFEHEVTEMTIHFISTTHPRPVFLGNRCLTSYFRVDMKIFLTCKQRKTHNNGCNDDNQCAEMTHSMCNKTTGLCQCKAMYLYLWETNTCAPARGIGESCNNSIQCEAKTPYSTCDTDKRCRCEQGYLALNDSCSPGRQLNDTCDDSIQCSAINPNATCDQGSGVCECTEGHLAISSRCINARGLGEQCEDYTQCQAATKYSMCNKNNECRCQQGYVEVNDCCVPVRRLKESCDSPIQCSETTANSTCNNKTGVCECIEGHLQISNTCLSVQILIDSISKNNESCSNSSGGCEQSEFERVCTSITNTPLRHKDKDKIYESKKNDNSGLVIGIGTACFILGAAIGGLVYFIITRNIRKTKLRSKTPSDDTTEQLSVQVSQQMNSRLVYNNDIRDKEEGNDVYIHLHQDPFEVDVQSDYDHAPQQMTAEDDYSHMNTCNKTLGLESDYYGEAS
ncbi:fibrillin-1-like [Crassostrea angulata]|uniref:fibrillin-1-like n=1 Tax=Magallana angulata TaxID=2784310 RepID=UPI0022B1A90A|nr:fibrillin-1-like [Crassostrea angulata]